MAARTIDDKASDTLVVVSGEGLWTGSSTLPHLHHFSGRRGGQEEAAHPAGRKRPAVRRFPDLGQEVVPAQGPGNECHVRSDQTVGREDF
jgi:hypothetical protein